MKISSETCKTAIVIIVIWALGTSINIAKPYHIDDTAHLEIARWITHEPLKPMSGLLNWDSDSEPIHITNQPHLYFYALALWGQIWGFGEVQMHILQSFFYFLAILMIFLIAKSYLSDHALRITALLSLNPAFVVNQNLMVDIPVLSLWLCFFYFLLQPKRYSITIRMVLCGFFAGLACLFKYSSLPLIFIMITFLVVHKKYKLLWKTLIPIFFIMLWSVFNYYDYGAIHILERSGNSLSFSPAALKSAAYLILIKSTAYLICLGGVIPYIFLLFFDFQLFKNPDVNPLKKLCWLIYLFLPIILVVCFLFYFISESFTDKILIIYFAAIGSSTLITVVTKLLLQYSPMSGSDKEFTLVMVIWIFASVLFTIFLAPFIASRHILLVIIPVVLLLAYLGRLSISRQGLRLAIFISFTLSLFLGLFDFSWANFYRQKAVEISSDLPKNSNIYFSGHWGWQWYASKSGMTQLESSKPQIRVGDYLVHPLDIAPQSLQKASSVYCLKVFKEYHHSFNPLLFLSTRGNFAAFYLNYISPPWHLSRNPIPSIIVFAVDNAPEGKGDTFRETNSQCWSPDK